MATQWTAGLSDGTPLPAATLNRIGAAWESYTPTLTQGVGVAIQNNGSKYCQINKTIIASVMCQANGAGTGGSSVQVSLPIAAVTTRNPAAAFGYIYDASTAIIYNCTGIVLTSTTIQFYYQSGTPWGGSPNIALAASDQLALVVIYEAA